MIAPPALLVFESPLNRVLLLVHLLISVFALGAVTHHWWLLLARNVQTLRLARHVRWVAIGYPLSWLFGVVIYPSYNVLVRKPPLGWLQDHAPWAVGLFEIKEHLATIALVMLPWLVLSARRYGQLSRAERVSYIAASWVFTIFVYFAFVIGGLVTGVKSF